MPKGKIKEYVANISQLRAGFFLFNSKEGALFLLVKEKNRLAFTEPIEVMEFDTIDVSETDVAQFPNEGKLTPPHS